MTDDLMKRSREWLQSCVNAATRSGTPEEADLEAFLLAHLDGEAARTQAACDRRAEEVREACAESVRGYVPPYLGFDWDGRAAVLNTPLTATPLGDENKALREVVQGMNEGALVVVSAAEYDELKALRARVAELEAQAAKDDAHVVEVNDAHLKQVAALRARVAELEASKKTLDAVCAVLGREVGNRGDSEGAVDVAERIIRERDEAVAALRDLEDGCLVADRSKGLVYLGRFERARIAARAVLAKYPEGKR